MRKIVKEEIDYYINEFKCLRKELVESYKNFIDIEKYNCELKGGIVIPRERIVKGRRDGSAAIILPVTEDDETLLVVQPRVFTRSGVGVELPAGYIENGEDAKVAALRELQEETGFLTDDIIHLAAYYQDQGCSAAFNHAFLARNCKRVGEQNLDKDEFIRFLPVRVDEMYELADLGYINDANSIITMEKARQYIKK